MNKYEYFKYAVKEKFIYKLDWLYSFFTIHNIEFKGNEYLRILNNRYEVKIDNLWHNIDLSIKNPIYNMLEEIEITKDMIETIDSKITTTIGRFLANKILLEYNFGNKIKYINSSFNIGKIEKDIADMMIENKLSVDEYLKFVDATSFLQGISRITNISSTEKGMLPPPNIEKIKKDLFKEFNDKYGEDWVKNRSRIVEYENKLKEVDSEWLKDDPANGKLLSGKIKNNARAKMYLAFGAEAGFDKKGKNVQFINNSLLDEYPEDNEKLATMFNTSRAGSFDRGKETQKGGAAAKDILRSTSSISIVDGDCGSDIGKKIFVTKSNHESLIGRYMLLGNKITKIENSESLLGKTITIRSPMFCKKDGSELCSICVGEKLANYKKGISLITTDISSILLNSSMKSMHSSVVTTMEFDIKEVIN